MLKIELSMPDACTERLKVIDACAEIDDDVIFIRIKACAHCGKMFAPVRIDHRFCYRGNCRMDFHNQKQTLSV